MRLAIELIMASSDGTYAEPLTLLYYAKEGNHTFTLFPLIACSLTARWGLRGSS